MCLCSSLFCQPPCFSSHPSMATPSGHIISNWHHCDVILISPTSIWYQNNTTLTLCASWAATQISTKPTHCSVIKPRHGIYQECASHCCMLRLFLAADQWHGWKLRPSLELFGSLEFPLWQGQVTDKYVTKDTACHIQHHFDLLSWFYSCIIWM